MAYRPRWSNPRPFIPGRPIDLQAPYNIEERIFDALNDLDCQKLAITDPISGSSLVGNLPLSGNIAVIDVDFGTTPTRHGTFTVTDTKVSATSVIFAQQSGQAASGRDTEDEEADPIVFSALAGAGQFTLYAHALDGPVVGLYRVQYLRS